MQVKVGTTRIGVNCGGVIGVIRDIDGREIATTGAYPLEGKGRIAARRAARDLAIERGWTVITQRGRVVNKRPE